MKKKLYFKLVISIMALLMLSSVVIAQESTIEVPAEYKGKTNPYWNDINAIKEGQALYGQNCVACHASNGKGNLPNQPDFRDINWWVEQKDDYLMWRVSEGVPQTSMPQWKTRLSEDDIWKILGYARTFPNQENTKTEKQEQKDAPGFTILAGAILLIIAAGLKQKYDRLK